jgi:glycosyltransferase involved in cell wall biosynthesis
MTAGVDRRISVVIPAYDAEPYLAEAIDSVLAQTLPAFELAVVDDGSADRTAEVARAYGDRVHLIRQPRAGNGAARNAGVAATSGEYLAFLDADDRFCPDKLELQMRALDEDPQLDIVFGHVREFVSPELPEAVKATVRPPSPVQPWAAPNLMLIRRAAFERVGPFATDLRVGVTVDWYARATEVPLTSRVLPEVVLERRLHTQNNGIREQDARSQYIHVLKASIDRRRRAER